MSLASYLHKLEKGIWENLEEHIKSSLNLLNFFQCGIFTKGYFLELMFMKN